ncbi:hypothetical protein C8R44DRAFT_756393 [Mycena epipterygia]|nr:hypothetical protein C8R44DRAFT_756393 [Mycena epipterygia]
MPAKINNVQTSARLAIMSDHDASEASVDAPQQSRSLSLAQTLCFTRLLSVLKRDILLVQPANVTTGTEEAPLVLPPSITEFVADAVGVPAHCAKYVFGARPPFTRRGIRKLSHVGQCIPGGGAIAEEG